MGRGTDEIGGLDGAVLGQILPRCQWGVGESAEVASDAEGRPCLELGVYVAANGLWLGAERVADKVDTLL